MISTRRLFVLLCAALCVLYFREASAQNVYTANYGNNTISKVTSGGSLTDPWATLASGANPVSIAIASTATTSPFIFTPAVIP